MLRTRALIPPLTIHALDGRTIRAWDFKQKRNLVILFLHTDCARCEEFLRIIGAETATWKSTGSVVLATFLTAPSRLLADSVPDAVVVGVDASGRAANAYLGRDRLAPAGDSRLGVFVADRYGELFAEWEVGAGHDFPAVATLAGQLEHMEMACDECGTPLW